MIRINFRDWVLIYLNIDKMCTYSQYLLFTLTYTGSRAGKDSLKAILSWEAGLKSLSSWDKPSAQIFFLWLLSQGGGRLWFQLVTSTFCSHLPRAEHSCSGSSSLIWKAVTSWWSEGVFGIPQLCLVTHCLSWLCANRRAWWHSACVLTGSAEVKAGAHTRPSWQWGLGNTGRVYYFTNPSFPEHSCTYY